MLYPRCVTLILLTGVSFDAIGKAIGHDEAWVAALFYGQVDSSLPINRAPVDLSIFPG